MMFWFSVQFALLLLAAYFAGAMLGCMVRRTFFAHTLQPKKALQPIQPHVSMPAQQVAPPPQQSRFERALTGAGAAPAPQPQPPPQPVAQASRPPAPAQPAVTPPAPPTPRAIPPSSAIPAAAEPQSGSAPAAAAAVTAAMTAVAAAARAQQQPAGILPAAMGTSGPATVTAPIAPPAPAPVPAAQPLAAPPPPAPAPVAAPATQPVSATAPQDLTRIRAIDEAMQKSLHGLGVNGFSDIAAWKPEDVSRVSNSLKIPGRIEQENWIEQAQILAKGGETYYSRRKQKGELPSARPTPDEGERITIRVPAATRPADAMPTHTPTPTPEAAAPTAQSAAAAAATAVQAAQAAVSASSATAAAAASAVAAAAAAVTAKAAAPEPAAPVAQSAPPSPAVEPPVVAVPAAQVIPPVSQRPIGMARDSLQRIAGINAEVERLLNVQGVTRFSQIASWSPSDVSRFDRLLGFEGRIARENWIEQAQILSKGGETAYSRDFARRGAEPARPAKLADALQARATESTSAIAASTAAAAATAAAVAATSVSTSSQPAERSGRDDLSSLRSVRSEAYRTPESAAAMNRPADDLKRIRGVGVLIEKKLNALGVMRYDQVANWTQADVDRFSEKLDFRGRIERENWVEQARILSAGGQTEFSQRVDRGEVESSRPKS